MIRVFGSGGQVLILSMLVAHCFDLIGQTYVPIHKMSYLVHNTCSYTHSTIYIIYTTIRSIIMRPFFAYRQKSFFIAGRTSIGCQKNKTKYFSVCVFICVIQHRNWPLRSTILNAHGTNASPDGLCTRTHTNEAFSCCFCCNSFRVDRARRGNVCL